MSVVRNDLKIAEFKNPGYLSDIILPRLPKPQDAGKIYYQKYAADTDAQTGRDTANLGDISESVMAANRYSFACSEIRGRKKMSYDQVIGYRTKLHADLAMARAAKRSFFFKIEKQVSSKLLGLAGAVDLSAASSLPAAIEMHAQELMDKGPGKIALVCSQQGFAFLKSDAKILDRMKNTGVVVGAGGDARQITAEQMAAACGVDQVLVGPNDAWYKAVTGSAKRAVCLCVLPDPNMEPADEIQLGRSIFFDYGDGADLFTVESFHDDNKDADCVDVKGQVDIAWLNLELARTLIVRSGSDESDSASGSGSDESDSASGADESDSDSDSVSG